MNWNIIVYLGSQLKNSYNTAFLFDFNKIILLIERNLSTFFKINIQEFSLNCVLLICNNNNILNTNCENILKCVLHVIKVF